MSLRVGFIGAGGMANAHMNALHLIDDVQIIAVADVNRQRAESAAAGFLATPYEDYHDMFENEKLDVVYVCVPPFAHEDQELIAASMGIHLFVEKPVAKTAEKAYAVLDAIKKNGIVAAAGYHWRYQKNTDRVKEKLQGKQIGMALGYWMCGLPDVAWWRNMELSGGQVMEQTTHIFDLARYLCGEISEVYAAYSNRIIEKSPDFSIYDVGTVTIKFENGAVGSISNTCALDFPYIVGIHIITKDLVIEMHGDLKIVEKGHTEHFNGVGNPILDENIAFINAVRSGDSRLLKSTYEDAVKTLKVTLACNESAALGMPVKIDY